MKRAMKGQARQGRPNRTKVQLCLWLRPETLAGLQSEARSRRLPVCELIEHYVRAGQAEQAEVHVEGTALPAVREAVRVALAEQSEDSENRLAKLLIRSIIASDTTRRLLFAHMARQWGGAEAIRPVHDSARTAAINALRERGWAAALRPEAEELPE